MTMDGIIGPRRRPRWVEGSADVTLPGVTVEATGEAHAGDVVIEPDPVPIQINIPPVAVSVTPSEQLQFDTSLAAARRGDPEATISATSLAIASGSPRLLRPVIRHVRQQMNELAEDPSADPGVRHAAVTAALNLGYILEHVENDHLLRSPTAQPTWKALAGLAADLAEIGITLGNPTMAALWKATRMIFEFWASRRA